VAIFFVIRLIRSRPYRAGFSERLGFLPQPFHRTKSGSIWLHAVSVGEVASALALIQRLRTERPSVPIYVSTSTVAGRGAAQRQLSHLVDGIFYSPIDYPFCIRRTLNAIRPSLLVVLETEIWPNLYSVTKRYGASLAIVNGRISDRTWPRYRSWAKWFEPVMACTDLVLVQSEKDRDRYAFLGVPREKLSVAPNLKYEAALSAAPIALTTFGARKIWIAASTVGPNERGSSRRHQVDEDDIVLAAFRQLATEFPELLLILVPRQPDRFDEVAKKLERSGLNFVRRTSIKADPDTQLSLPGVLLLDTLGELPGIYSLANVTFVGGSIAPRGGHNILEPASAGSPIVVGPHMENFDSIAEDFRLANAFVRLQNADELLPAVRILLTDTTRARELGARAKRLVEARRDSAAAICEQLWILYFGASQRKIRNRFARALLLPLAGLWTEGGVLKRKHSEHFTLISPPLSAPVISVGGITVGGSGKTPFTVYLVNQLKNRGFEPAILTRGYKRRSPAEILVFGPQTKVPAAVTGDEAQIFLRATQSPIGIGSKRYETAQILLRQYPDTSALVLDDGFQHARLEREFDVVLIDGLDPLGGGEVVPLGRLREPAECLSRADAFVVTRAEETHRFKAICRRLAEYNRKAPVFRTRLLARSWRDYCTGQVLSSLEGKRVGAFCGLGNPEGFWRTLDSLGLTVVFQWSFPDHHAYKPLELQRVAHHALSHGAEILVTTEKDRMNCPGHLESVISPLPLAWLEIELELDDSDAFFDLLNASIRHSRQKQLIV
jgi:3-deoxy-D-manno-octulosonic-acid transferase